MIGSDDLCAWVFLHSKSPSEVTVGAVEAVKMKVNTLSVVRFAPRLEGEVDDVYILVEIVDGSSHVISIRVKSEEELS